MVEFSATAARFILHLTRECPDHGLDDYAHDETHIISTLGGAVYVSHLHCIPSSVPTSLCDVHARYHEYITAQPSRDSSKDSFSTTHHLTRAVQTSQREHACAYYMHHTARLSYGRDTQEMIVAKRLPRSISSTRSNQRPPESQRASVETPYSDPQSSSFGCLKGGAEGGT